ncbi:MAG TPA: hypothetical protein VK104_11090 [Burkholderiaceae bacterium]|nr:hypothetical protein [Burkholderiaceae bacterium]
MNIGILQCDDVNSTLQPRHSNYPDMFVRLLQGIEPGLRFRVWRCHEGELPATPTEADAWLITGSRHGVNDDLPWIPRLSAFLIKAQQAGQPIVGICFGHQLVAKTFGGKVRKHPEGWGIGVSVNTVRQRQPWMLPFVPALHVLVSHADQVSTLPDDTTVLASSGFCPFYAIQIRDNVLGIQGHPEFTKDYAKDLMLKRTDTIPAERIKTALQSLDQHVDDATLAAWILNFMRHVHHASQPSESCTTQTADTAVAG